MLNKKFWSECVIPLPLNLDVDKQLSMCIYKEDRNNVFRRFQQTVKQPFRLYKSNEFLVDTLYQGTTKAIISYEITNESLLLRSRTNSFVKPFYIGIRSFEVIVSIITLMVSISNKDIKSIVIISTIFIIFELFLTGFHSIYKRETDWAFKLIEKSICEGVDISKVKYNKFM